MQKGGASEMPKTYDPAAVEERLYQKWENNGYFKPAETKPEGKKAFSIVMPPPNITGQLHMGHAMDGALPDILIRYHRMLGDDTLWLPGTDHASIATEVKIVEQLAREGIDKRDLGRENFLKRAWLWRDEYGGRIVEQQRKLGLSCDWSRERFTMDEGCSKAVLEVFVRLYQDGLIYRGDRIINWCPECQTALSDAEVEYDEEASFLWHIRYPAADGGEGLVVATTRPETMLGDTGVAVNPDDERYAALIGKNLLLPILNREIPVVADEYVEREFGTGAVKMTPAHDPNDFEVAQRHDLPVLRVMNDNGTMNALCGPEFEGLSAAEARKKVVSRLQELGLLVKAEPYAHNVGHCYRCQHTVEPLVSTQWFVKMKPLAEPAVEALKSGKIRFVPERMTKTYYNWMENIRDWCISRQLWWGHRIPAYYCAACGHMEVSKIAVTKCERCGSAEIRQDEDALDTWFSSALWPFSTLGWPDQSSDLARFYPNTLMIMGYDILFFWAARMIFSGLYNTGEAPFKDLLFHGLVRDGQGRKMSKSLGNGIDPLEIVDRFGADALRFSLVNSVSPGNDMRFSEEKAEAARNFANKVYNACRFALMNLEGEIDEKGEKSLADRWILTAFARCARAVTEHLDQLDIAMAAQKLYDYIWSELCDWYLELAKAALYGGDERAAAAARGTLRTVLEGTLKLLHPFMPFLTDSIYEYLPGAAEDSLMIAPWPQGSQEYPEAAAQMERIMDVIRAVRNLRAEMNVPPSRKAQIHLVLSEPGDEKAFLGAESYFARLASASLIRVVSAAELPKNAVSAICPAAQAYLPIEELVDLEKEKARLQKEIGNLQGEIVRAEGKLQNQGFIAKAPQSVVEGERAKLATNRAMLEKLQDQLAGLGA
ncbi:MAG: valine--tRNA ligase [Christensenellaceae bacterium]|jgi:valyl-tRNA synthetase|nr:valine--tRNA ligase [Christensenellaceae bacterium]